METEGKKRKEEEDNEEEEKGGTQREKRDTIIKNGKEKCERRGIQTKIHAV